MTTFKHFLTFCFLLMLSGNAFAAHIVGGGITYECLGDVGNNEVRYRFTMKVYRDCASGGANFDSPAHIGIYQGSYLVNIEFATFDIPLENAFPININEPDCIDNLPFLCIQEGIYVWEYDLPKSDQSYFIEYQRCCRTNAIANIVAPDATGATYYTEITPAAQQLCNNSPVFNNFPPVVICNNYPLEVDYSATDAEGDQLVYSFCAPFSGGGNVPGSFDNCEGVMPNPPCAPPFTEVNFITPTYTPNQPMGGNPVISIDAQSGLITGTPQINGQFVVGVCVEEYRNGVLISVTRRDFQFNVTDCAPQVTALVDHDELASPKHYVIKECSGTKTLTIINQSIPMANIVNFEWNFDLNGTIVTSTADVDLTLTFPDYGIYNGFLALNPGLDCGDTAFVQVQLYEPASLDLGPDFTLCQDSTVVLDAGPDFASYLWQDGSTGQTFSATTTGTYFVQATDHCDNVLRDTVFVTLGAAPPIQLTNVGICAGESATLEASGFAQYEWSPAAGLSCTTCPVVIAQPAVSTTYTLLATTQSGCTATGSSLVEVFPIPMRTYVIQFFPNQSVTIGGQTYTQDTTFTLSVPATTGRCDSINTYILELLPTTLTLQCPADMTVALPNNAATVPVNYAAPVANTDCPGTPPTITLSSGLASGSGFPGGLNTVCYGATNTCGNQASCCFTIRVTTLDLQCPANLTVAMPNNANSVPVNYPMPTATTDCPGSVPVVTLTQGSASGANFQAGVTNVCYGATNTCGNQDACCFTVTVSTLNIQCPPNKNVELPVAATTVNVTYAAPTSTTNCPDPAVTLSLLQGQASGSNFSLGPHTVCYQGTNTCGNVDSCCFIITILDAPPPCDIKVIGCMKFELLDIRLDSIHQPRFRIRTTNFCATEMDYVINELPPGIVAVTPVEASVYTAPNTGNTYKVRNPNASPFYSVRYRSISPGLKNGQSDVFEHRLTQQSFPNNYIHMFARLKNGEGYEAYLNTFYCPVQPWAGNRDEEPTEALSTETFNPMISLHPNPSSGLVWVDMQAWKGQAVQLRLINAQGQEVLNQRHTPEEEWLELNLEGSIVNGLYYLVVQPVGGAKATATFVLQR